ncbi:dynamin-binding protein isoform X1 [Lampetra planeri]
MEAGSLLRAMFEFRPSVPEELTLFVGDVVLLLDTLDEFWLLGKKDGVTGQFPSSFVEPVPIPKLQAKERLYVCTESFNPLTADSLEIKRGDVLVIEEALDTNWFRGRRENHHGLIAASCVTELRLPARPSRGGYPGADSDADLVLPANALGRARAIMGLAAQMEGELDFREGDIITITGIPEEGWYDGEIDGRRGTFPEGFVELLKPLKKMNVKDHCQDEELLDSDQSTLCGSEYGPLSQHNVDENEIYAVALYDFKAIEAGELDFRKGDRITIVQELEDDWLEGEVRGCRGIFPIRFVKLEAKESPVSDLVQTMENDPNLNRSKKENTSFKQSKSFDVYQKELPCNLLENNEELSRDSSNIEISVVGQQPDVLESSFGMSSTSETPKENTGLRFPSSPVRRYDVHPEVGENKDTNVGKPVKIDYTVTIRSEQETSKRSHNRESVHQDLLQWVATQKRHAKDRSESFEAFHVNEISSSSTECTVHNGGLSSNCKPKPDSLNHKSGVGLSGCTSTDLESKLTEQVMQFNQSLSTKRSYVSLEAHDLLQGPQQQQLNNEQGQSRPPIPPRPDVTQQPQPPPRAHRTPPPPPTNRRASAPLKVPPLLRANMTVWQSAEDREGGGKLMPTRPAPMPPGQAGTTLETGAILSRAASVCGDRARDGAAVSAPVPPYRRNHSSGDLSADLAHVRQRLQPGAITRPASAQLQTHDLIDLGREDELLDFGGSHGSQDSNLDIAADDMTLLSGPSAPMNGGATHVGGPPNGAAPEARALQGPQPGRALEKRKMVLEELLRTERDYLADLQFCREEIYIPLRKTQVANLDVEGLFGNLEAVLEVNARFYESLQSAVHIARPDDQKIGEIFLAFKSELEEVYKVYCRNHDDAISLLEAFEKDEDIKAQMAVCLKNMRERSNYINLGALLIKPVQRVMRYPLLLTELLGATPPSHPDQPSLSKALVALRQLNHNINEFKRRKDLVVKYRKDDDSSLIDKLSKLNMHSILKKSSRVSGHLKHLTGMASQIRDEAFEEEERGFRGLERAVKSFLRSLSLYTQQLREALAAELQCSSSFLALHAKPDADRYQQTCRHITTESFPQFKDRVDRLVISPLSALLASFAGPHKLVQKRYDKLLDYSARREASERNRDRPESEELQATQKDYVALNAQLLEELPLLRAGGQALLGAAARNLVAVHRDLVLAILQQLHPLDVQAEQQGAFGARHVQALAELQRFSFMCDPPDSLRRGLDGRHSMDRRSASRLSGILATSGSTQTDSGRSQLLARFPPDRLFVLDRKVNVAQDLDLALSEGELVAVIKQQDPMGSHRRWFVSNGVAQGFVYSSFLRPYSPRTSQSATSVSSQSSAESVPTRSPHSSPILTRQNSSSSTQSSGSSAWSGQPPEHPSPLLSRQNSDTSCQLSVGTARTSATFLKKPQSHVASGDQTADSTSLQRNGSGRGSIRNQGGTSHQTARTDCTTSRTVERLVSLEEDRTISQTPHFADTMVALDSQCEGAPPRQGPCRHGGGQSGSSYGGPRPSGESSWATVDQDATLQAGRRSESGWCERQTSLDVTRMAHGTGAEEARIPIRSQSLQDEQWDCSTHKEGQQAARHAPRTKPGVRRKGKDVYYAVYAFEARGAEEMSLRTRQRVRIVQFRDASGNQDWWLVESEGRQGYVPATYIAKMEYT